MPLLFISETVQLAIVNVVVPAITAAGVILLGWWAYRKIALEAIAATKKAADEMALVAARQEMLVEKTDHVIEQGVQIHTLTNSTLSRTQEELKVSQETVKGQVELIKSLVESKRVADELSTRKVGVQGTPLSPSTETPTPIVDEQVADLIRGDMTDKLDTIQDTVDEKAQSL